MPGARVENVAAMGDERQHARFTLVTAGGSRSRGVAFGSAPGIARPATRAPHDIVLRLERNRWKGVEEPRILLRALCDTQPGQVRALGEDGSFWQQGRHACWTLPGTSLPAGARRVRSSIAAAAGSRAWSGS